MPDLPPQQLRQLLCAADLYHCALGVVVHSAFKKSTRHSYIRGRELRARNAFGRILCLAGFQNYSTQVSRLHYSIPVDTARALLGAVVGYIYPLWRELSLNDEEKERYQMALVTIRFALTDLRDV